MPRKSILTAKERASLLSHPTDEHLLIEHWTLHPEDLILVNTRRKTETRFALALQLCSLRYPGRLIAAGDTIPAEAVQFLAEQLATRPDVLLDACNRAATRSEHLDILRRAYGFQEMTQPHRAELLNWVRGMAIASPKARPLVFSLAEEMRRRRIIIPGVTVLERLVAQALHQAESHLYEGVHGSLTDLAIGALDALVSDKPVHGRQHQISWLREPPGPQGSRAMIAIIQRLDLIREIDITQKTSELIGMERRINLAAEGKRLTAQNYRQMNAPRRYTTLAATVFELGLDLTDQVINMFEALIARSVRRAHRRREERAQEEALNSQEAMAFLRDLAVVLVDAHDTGRPLDPAITTFTTWDEIRRIVGSIKPTRRFSAENNLLVELRAEYAAIRRYASPFLAAFEFKASAGYQGLVEALLELSQRWHRRPGRMTEADWVARFLPFVPSRARQQIMTVDGGFDHKMMEIHFLLELKARLASGDVTVVGSRAYQTIETYLLPRGQFELIQKAGTLPIAVNPDFWDYIAARKAELETALQAAAKHLADNRGDTRIGAKGLRVPAVFTEESEQAVAFAGLLSRHMPTVRLTDLLMDVDRMTGFTETFEHLQTGRPCADKRALFTALIAEATNLGLSKMAQASPGRTRRQLQQTAIWHFREDTFALALAKLIEAQHGDAFATVFGSPTISSSDGQHIFLGAAAENAGEVNAHYGRDPIIKLYTAISGRYAPYHTRVMAATASEALHVLDALLETPTGQAVTRHHVDGGGVNDLVFATCHLLGYAFNPRIPNLDGRCLFGFRPAKDYGVLHDVMGDRLDASQIAPYWDDILHMMTSLRTRTVSSSLLLKRLSSAPKRQGLSNAIRLLGRIERTLFTLQWINDKDLRKQTTAELNKGEARNALVRAVNLHRLGRFRDRSQENLSIRASALNLVVTAIIYWNSVHMGRAVAALRDRGQHVSDEWLSTLSPLGWEHINLTGDYIWEDEPGLDDEGFRPIPFLP